MEPRMTNQRPMCLAVGNTDTVGVIRRGGELGRELLSKVKLTVNSFDIQ